MYPQAFLSPIGGINFRTHPTLDFRFGAYANLSDYKQSSRSNLKAASRCRLSAYHQSAFKHYNLNKISKGIKKRRNNYLKSLNLNFDQKRFTNIVIGAENSYIENRLSHDRTNLWSNSYKMRLGKINTQSSEGKHPCVENFSKNLNRRDFLKGLTEGRLNQIHLDMEHGKDSSNNSSYNSNKFNISNDFQNVKNHSNNFTMSENGNNGNNRGKGHGNGGNGGGDNSNNGFMSNPGDGGGWWLLNTALLAFGASMFFQLLKPRFNDNKNIAKDDDNQRSHENHTSEKNKINEHHSDYSKGIIESSKAESFSESKMISASSIFAVTTIKQAKKCNLDTKKRDLMIECDETLFDMTSFENTQQIVDDIQTITNPNSKEAQEKILKYHEELYSLWERLSYVHGLLQKSENRRKTMSEELKILSNKHEKEAESLKSLICKQEEENKKIRRRLSQIHQERDALVSILHNTQSSLATLQPNISQMHGQIGELTSAVRDQKSSLKKLKSDLINARKEKESVGKKISEYSNDVSDIEDLIKLVENAKDLITCSDMDLLVEKTATIDNCIQALQSYMLKPSGNRKKTRVKDVGNRVVILFERMLVELKKSIKQIMDSSSKLRTVQERLVNTTKEEKDLKSEVDCKRNQISGLIEEKASIERNLISLEKELSTVKEKIKNSKQLETNMKSGISTLEQEKKALASTVDKLEREVAEIENILQTIEKTRDIIMNSNPSSTGKEQVQVLDDCVQILQQHMLTPSTYDDVSRDTSMRLVKIFQTNLIETKSALLKTDECKTKFEETKNNLEEAERGQNELKLTMDQMREKVENLEVERSALNNRCDDLHKELYEKTEVLKNASNKEKEMTEAIEKLNMERDELQRHLDDSEYKLELLKSSYSNEVKESNDAKKRLEGIEKEKNNLELQKVELNKRIQQFQEDMSKMQVDAHTMEINLEKERDLRNAAEISNKELKDSKQEMERKMKDEISELRIKLEDAKAEKERMYMEIEKSDEHKKELIAKFEKESESLKQRISDMESKGIPVNVEILEKTMHQSSLSSLPKECSIVPETHEAENIGQSDLNVDDVNQIENEPRKKVQDWIDDSVRMMDNEQHLPSRGSGTVIENQSLDASALNEQQNQSIASLTESMNVVKMQQMKQRRTSWPQDMKITMCNQWYDTVQDMVELTSTSYELAVEREALLSELTEVREAVTEARTQLEEREAEISDLTQHFLQVYQIASDLAADNDDQMSELKQLRQQSEQLKSMLEDRDDRIAAFEAQFAAYNVPPPCTSRSHYRPHISSSSDLNGMVMTTPITDPFIDHPTTPGSALSTDQGRARTRIRSLGSMAYEPQEVSGNTPHPSTPSVMNALFAGEDGQEGSANDNMIMGVNGVGNRGVQLNSRRLANSSLSSQRDESYSPLPSDVSSLSSVSSMG